MAAADVKGAVRIASSDDSVLKPSPEIKKKLEEKHPKWRNLSQTGKIGSGKNSKYFFSHWAAATQF